jgi:hypothetical protein
MTYSETEAWIESELEKLDVKYRVVFYYVDKYICKRIFRDRAFMADRYVELEAFWKRILAYKADFNLYQKEIESIDATAPTKKGRGSSKPKQVLDLTTTSIPPVSKITGFAFSD